MGKSKKNAENSDPTKLPWTNEMDLVLLKLVQHHGAHLPHITYDKTNPKPEKPVNGKPIYHSRPADRFRDVTLDFYKDPNGGLPFKEKFLKLQKNGTVDYRRCMDHYDTLCKDVTEDIATGNQSGKEGDLSDVYKLVQTLTEEYNQAEATKTEDKKVGDDLKERLDTTVDQVINGKKNNANKNSAVKIKMADGTIVIDAEREAKRAKAMGNTLDGKLFQVLEAQLAPKRSVAEELAERFETILVQMTEYILVQGHDLEAFLFEAYSLTSSKVPTEGLQEKIQDVGGLEMLIESYCARDDNFEPTRFANLMADFSIPAKDARIMHVRLDKWRKNAAAQAKAEEQQAKNSAKAQKTADVTPTTSMGNPSPPVALEWTPPQTEHYGNTAGNEELQGHLGILAYAALGP